MDGQQIITLGLVAGAAASIGVRVYKNLKGNSGGSCPGCGECGREPRPDLRPAPKATPLVTLSVGSPNRPRPAAPAQAQPTSEN